MGTLHPAQILDHAQARGCHFAEDRKACLEAGMDDHLVKPLEPEALRSALTRWTNRDNRFKVAV